MKTINLNHESIYLDDLENGTTDIRTKAHRSTYILRVSKWSGQATVQACGTKQNKKSFHHGEDYSSLLPIYCDTRIDLKFFDDLPKISNAYRTLDNFCGYGSKHNNKVAVNLSVYNYKRG